MIAESMPRRADRYLTAFAILCGNRFSLGWFMRQGAGRGDHPAPVEAMPSCSALIMV
jgi:hypothetical protein